MSNIYKIVWKALVTKGFHEVCYDLFYNFKSLGILR